MDDQPAKSKHATRIFWLIMFGISILLLGMKILQVPYFENIRYRYVIAPLWAPLALVGIGIIISIFISLYIDFKKKK